MGNQRRDWRLRSWGVWGAVAATAGQGVEEWEQVGRDIHRLSYSGRELEIGRRIEDRDRRADQ